jgi:hypothetical protein
MLMRLGRACDRAVWLVGTVVSQVPTGTIEGGRSSAMVEGRRSRDVNGSIRLYRYVSYISSDR